MIRKTQAFKMRSLRLYHAETLALVRSPKLSNIVPAQIRDGAQIGNSRCFKLGRKVVVIDKVTEFVIEELNSNSNLIFFMFTGIHTISPKLWLNYSNLHQQFIIVGRTSCYLKKILVLNTQKWIDKPCKQINQSIQKENTLLKNMVYNKN